MRKLKLESLQVQSFATTPAAPSARGTVQAHADSDESVCFCQASGGSGCVSWEPAYCIETGVPCNIFSEECVSLFDDC